MGNAIYGKNLSCFDTVEHCAEHCGKYECVFVDKCNGNANLNYICLPIDTRYLTWILFACFLIVILTCSAIVACYACRAIKHSFRHAIATENDIIFYNTRNVVTMPHPAAKQYRDYREPPRENEREWNLRKNGYY
jgi:hypothetical protein